MKKITLYTLLIILFQSCQEANNPIDNTKVEEKITNDNFNTTEFIHKEEEPVTEFDIETHLKNYKSLKSSIANQKRTIRNRTDIDQDAKIELVKDYMAQTLVDSIFPYWLGTEWDFNGYTETPRQGVVACGYFVSTTLRDLGIKLNRFKIAQMGASDIIYALCDKETVVKLSSVDKVNEYMRSVKENEILIVGLDFHVGFLFKKNNKNYFAHSNYIQMKGVEIELAENSMALSNSNLYVIGNLMKNEKMLIKWLN